jgi:membrane-anchored protein YejM (alkaline phosphatase superfamily)
LLLVHEKQALAMETSVRLLTVLAALAVFLILLAGLWNMMRGTSPNLSQKLMRWRVGLQFLAILIGMLLVYFWRT